MRLLVDEQLPPALARWFADAGHAADHFAWLGLERASDDAIWREAIRLGAAIVSKDDDFARRRVLSSDGPPIVWIRLGNMRTPALLRAVAGAMPRISEALARGEALVELL